MSDDGDSVRNIRDVFGRLIGQRVADVLQHDREEWEEEGAFFIELCFERGDRVRFLPDEDGGRIQLFTEDEEDPMPVTKENVDDVFTYHAPDADQIAKLQAVREDAKRLAHTILEAAPGCADTQAGIRLLREAVMTVNAAIALKGAV